MWMLGTHPDSVSLVKPPKTTIPNTLAALPSSQYATVLVDVLGKDEPLPASLLAASSMASIVVAADLDRTDVEKVRAHLD